MNIDSQSGDKTTNNIGDDNPANGAAPADATEHSTAVDWVRLRQIWDENKKKIEEWNRTSEVYVSDEYPYGTCKACWQSGRNSSPYVNVYKEHWFHCGEHRIKWCPGYNLMSSWQYEDQADWNRNKDMLADFRDVQ